MLITIEGIDGTGKSTVCDLLAKKYPFAVMTHEPQDKEMIRWYDDNPYMELYAYLLDHAEHVENLIRRKYNDNLIICDRYIDSRVAYQSAKIGIPMERIYDMHFNGYSIIPHMTFILTCDMDEVINRLTQRDGEMFYYSDILVSESARSALLNDYIIRMDKIQRKYIEIAKDWSNRCVCIDVTNMTPEEVANTISEKINLRYGQVINYIYNKKVNSNANTAPTPS